MSLRLLIGRAGTDKSDFMKKEIRASLRKTQTGAPIYYIVPEQMTFQQEYALFHHDDIPGSIRAHVVSFSRLAWRMLQETGGSRKQFISSTGIQMMLRKIVTEKYDELLMFQKAVDKQGFIEELETIITEFKRHLITPEVLQEQLSYTTDYVPLQRKLFDLHLIYDQLTIALHNKYIDGEDQLTLLLERIVETEHFHGAYIYLDGFHRFTPKELAIVTELMKVAERVTVALTTDPEMYDESNDELDLFYQSNETVRTLFEAAKEADIPIEQPMLLHDKDNRLQHNAPLFHLEANFDVRPAHTFTAEVQEPFPIQVAEAVHPRAEVEGMIQEILRLVREENYRFRDIVVYVRETDAYYDLITTLFDDFDIPVFIDEKRTMLNHPFIEFVRSLFDTVESNWRYDAMFRLLKTGFLPSRDASYPLTRDAIDELENYVLEYGVRGKSQWTMEDDWKFVRFRGFQEAAQTDAEKEMEEKLNRYRKQIVATLRPFDAAMKEAKTIRERAETLFVFLEEIQIIQQLEGRRKTFEGKGELVKAREEEQVWDAFLQLLDEMVEMIGEEHVDFSMFHNMLEAGLEALQFAHVPPSIDHVIVGTIDHSRIAMKKCAFLLGVNEGSWPKKPALDGLISEKEREYLEHFGLKLAASSRRTLLDESFYMYLAFSSATDKLWVSYVISDDEGNGKTKSPMISRLEQLFPNVMPPRLLTDPEGVQEASRFITTPMKTRAALTTQLARYLRGYPVDAIWWNVLDWYMTHEQKEDTTYKVLQSLFYENRPKNLTESTVKQLHPKRVQTSVSRLEMLYRCSYQHFLQYGLKLEERRTYSLEAPDIGQLFHEALKTITEWLQQEKKDFADLSKQESAQYAEKSMQHLAPILNNRILQSSNRYRYLQRKLQEVIAQATFILSEQARASGFSPIGFELDFGYGKTLDPLRIMLPNGYELILRGRIDRVDKADGQDHLYLRIIDYKSSSRGLNLVDVYYGLALQMLAYFDVVLSQAKVWLGKEAHPAGVLYFHVHNAMLSLAEKISEEDIFHEIVKQYKMTGLLTKNLEVAQLMDHTVEAGRSNIAPFGLKRNGEFYADSKVTDEATFTLLRNHIHHLIEQAGIEITSGNIELNPYENAEGNACRFCAYKSVCQFDPVLSENKFRRLPPLKEEDVLDDLKKRYKK